MALRVLDMNNVKGAGMSFAVDKGTNTTQISTSGDHAEIARVEFDVIGDFAGGNINLHGIVGFDQWIRITNGAAIMCNQERHTLGTQLCLANLAQFVLK